MCIRKLFASFPTFLLLLLFLLCSSVYSFVVVVLSLVCSSLSKLFTFLRDRTPFFPCCFSQGQSRSLLVTVAAIVGGFDVRNHARVYISSPYLCAFFFVEANLTRESWVSSFQNAFSPSPSSFISLYLKKKTKSFHICALIRACHFLVVVLVTSLFVRCRLKALCK